ncbi:Fe-S cluster assembly protein SufD, partial [bacterium]
ERTAWVAAGKPQLSTDSADSGDSADSIYIEGLDAVRIVVVDGYLMEVPDKLPDGLELLRGDRDVAFAAEQLDRSRAFELLNLAATPEPFLLKVSRPVEQIVHLVHMSSSSDTPRLASPRIRVEVQAQASLHLIEDHRAAPGSTDLVNLHVDLEAGQNAQVRWTRLVRTGVEHRHLARMQVRQARDSVVRMQVVTLAGALVRHDVAVLLEGSNAECVLHGLVVGEGAQIADNHSVIRHRADHTRSAEHFRNVLDGSSRAVFAGRVVVEKGRRASEALQSNANLLLSDTARVDALPQLEIYNDDVKASHGSTLGRLDADSMFYLRSRGIDEPTARAILTWAFANVVVEEIAADAIRALVRQDLFRHLPGAGIDESVLGGLE